MPCVDRTFNRPSRFLLFPLLVFLIAFFGCSGDERQPQKKVSAFSGTKPFLYDSSRSLLIVVFVFFLFLLFLLFLLIHNFLVATIALALVLALTPSLAFFWLLLALAEMEVDADVGLLGLESKF